MGGEGNIGLASRPLISKVTKVKMGQGSLRSSRILASKLAQRAENLPLPDEVVNDELQSDVVLNSQNSRATFESFN